MVPQVLTGTMWIHTPSYTRLVNIFRIIRINISNTLLFTPNILLEIKPTSIVLLMYYKIHFTVSQWPLQGSCMYLLTIETACDKSSLVPTITYIKLITTLARVCETYTWVRRHSRFYLEVRGQQSTTDFVSPLMLNFWSTFYKYPFCVKQTFPLFRSLSISIPSIFFASPRYFIPNMEEKCFFNLSIADLLLKAMSILSTYNSR